MMQQVQPKSAATRADATTPPFIELAYSQGWNNALYQLMGLTLSGLAGAGSAAVAARRLVG